MLMSASNVGVLSLRYSDNRLRPYRLSTWGFQRRRQENRVRVLMAMMHICIEVHYWLQFSQNHFVGVVVIVCGFLFCQIRRNERWRRRSACIRNTRRRAFHRLQQHFAFMMQSWWRGNLSVYFINMWVYERLLAQPVLPEKLDCMTSKKVCPRSGLWRVWAASYLPTPPRGTCYHHAKVH